MHRVLAFGLLFCAAIPSARGDCPKQPLPSAPDVLSDRPYATEPPKPCTDLGQDIVQAPPPPLRKLAFGGLGSGAALLAVGGVFWLSGALTSDPGGRRVSLTTAAVLGITGGVFFLTGTTLVIVSGALGVPSPKGMQSEELVLSGTF